MGCCVTKTDYGHTSVNMVIGLQQSDYKCTANQERDGHSGHCNCSQPIPYCVLSYLSTHILLYTMIYLIV